MIQKIRNTLQEQMLEYMFWKRQNGSDFLIQVSKLAYLLKEWQVQRCFGGKYERRFYWCKASRAVASGKDQEKMNVVVPSTDLYVTQFQKR